jgi:anti-sigma factor RsiW
MTCCEVIDFLMAYLNGDLPPAQRTEFEAHLAVCPPCVAYLKSYERSIRLGHDACCHPEAACEVPVPEDLVKAIMAAREKSGD